MESYLQNIVLVCRNKIKITFNMASMAYHKWLRATNRTITCILWIPFIHFNLGTTERNEWVSTDELITLEFPLSLRGIMSFFHLNLLNNQPRKTYFKIVSMHEYMDSLRLLVFEIRISKMVIIVTLVADIGSCVAFPDFPCAANFHQTWRSVASKLPQICPFSPYDFFYGVISSVLLTIAVRGHW